MGLIINGNASINGYLFYFQEFQLKLEEQLKMAEKQKNLWKFDSQNRVQIIF